jgi:hypothetical protein
MIIIINHAFDNDELNIGSENMKKEMIFPPNGIDVLIAKRIVAPFIGHIIKINKGEKGDKGRIDKRVKIIKAKAIHTTNRKGDFGVNAVDNSSPRIIGFSPKIKTSKE